MSALFQNYEQYGLVYVININTHVILLFLYYLVVPLALFWAVGRFKVLADCQWIVHSVIIYSSKQYNISKVDCGSLEILILLFDFSYFYVEHL